MSLLCRCAPPDSAYSLLLLFKARIALLEGERRSFENTRMDLLRRIKMLEFALRMERYEISTNVPGGRPLTVVNLGPSSLTNL